MLDQLAAMAAIRGNGVEVALFSKASRLVQSAGIGSDADLGPLLDAPPPGTDPDLLQQLRYMYDAGAWVLFESAVADLPSDLRWLFESGAVTIEQLAALHEGIGPTSAADLIAEIRRHGLGTVPGLDATVEAAIARALPTLRAALPRIPLGRAVAISEPVLARLRDMPGVTWALPVGSLRRGQDTVGDIELVAPAEDPGPILDNLSTLPDIARRLYRSQRRLYLLLDRVQIGIRCPPPHVAGATLLHLTGSQGHLDRLGALAAARGWTLGPEGVQKDDRAAPIAATEEEIYSALGLPFIAPELRNGADEIAAAERGELPHLVTRADIRGDLHMHTDWSDGRDPTGTMVEGCVAMGYEYLAITDHSQHSAASRNLTLDGVARQAAEIAGLREKYPQIVILHGCEVDILADGRLDFPDRVLQQFDIVLASLHDSAGQRPDQLLRRYLGAMQHPLVTIVTHPTNRLVPYRPGYDLDYDKLIAGAVETGTVLEVDGSPAHLDMDGALARRAIVAGALVAIDSDSHRADMLERQMQLGLLTARRGWVEPRHVINTRPIADLRAFIAAKRSR
jgi:DNA polymerase (family 10)